MSIDGTKPSFPHFGSGRDQNKVVVRMPVKAALSICFLLAPIGAQAGSAGLRLCSDVVLPVPAETVVAGGLRAYVDPDTGELLEGPSPGQDVSSKDSMSEAPRTQSSTASDDEFEITVAADGTQVIKVGDRFMTELHAELVDGEVVTCHRLPPGMRVVSPATTTGNGREAVPDDDDPDHADR